MSKNSLETVVILSVRHLQQDDHGEEHVETSQTGTVQVTVAVGDQVRRPARQRLQPEEVTWEYQDSGINHTECQANRTAIFGTTLYCLPVSSFFFWHVFGPVAKLSLFYIGNLMFQHEWK